MSSAQPAVMGDKGKNKGLSGLVILQSPPHCHLLQCPHSTRRKAEASLPWQTLRNPGAFLGNVGCDQPVLGYEPCLQLLAALPPLQGHLGDVEHCRDAGRIVNE